MTDLVKQRHSTPAENLRVLLALRGHTFSVAERLEIEEAADALESSGELPEEPSADRLHEFAEQIGEDGLPQASEHLHNVAGQIHTLRTAYSALAARLREREAKIPDEPAYEHFVCNRGQGDHDEIFVRRVDYTDLRAALIDTKGALDSSRLHTKHWMERAEQAETLNGLQAANITQLAAELTQAGSSIAELERDAEKISLYYELIYAVGKKYPDETRHQTALRYIRNAETSDGSDRAAKNATVAPHTATDKGEG